MTMKKSAMMLSALAMMAAMDPGYKPEYQRKQVHLSPKENRKKCKSCAEFNKGYSYSSCPWHSFLDPQQTACSEHYRKRKK